MGMKTMLLEKRGFLGGNVTACYVETCNYFMKGTPFAPQGIAREVEEGFDREYPSDDLRPNADAPVCGLLAKAPEGAVSLA